MDRSTAQLAPFATWKAGTDMNGEPPRRPVQRSRPDAPIG
jgi:hypothetical protein